MSASVAPECSLHQNYIHMKQTIFRYGIYATLLIVALGGINYFIVAKYADHSLQEVAGYLTMFLSMIFVFLGIRHYRDQINGGSLSFGQGMKIGVLIVLIPAVCFGFFDLLYTQVLNPGWVDEYYKIMIDQLKANTPADQLTVKLKEMEQQKEFFSNPVLLFLVMAATVFIIGLLVTIISSIALRRSKTVA